MKWLLKDEQLLQLKEEFNEKVFIPLMSRAKVAMKMKLPVELVNHWYEHKKATFVMSSTKTNYDREYDFIPSIYIIAFKNKTRKSTIF